MLPTDTPPLAIVLDLGGVLIDVDFERSLRHWYAVARQPDPAQVRVDRDLVAEMATDVATDPVTAQAYERHERGEIAFSGFTQALTARLQLELDESQWRRGWNAALGDTLPGALALTRNIAKRWPVYLFSNTNATHHAHWQTQHRELLAPLREVFVSNDLRLRKPDPRAYQHVAARIGIDPQCIVFFDDRQDNVDGARQAGMQAHQVNRPKDIADLLGLP